MLILKAFILLLITLLGDVHGRSNAKHKQNVFLGRLNHVVQSHLQQQDFSTFFYHGHPRKKKDLALEGNRAIWIDRNSKNIQRVTVPVKNYAPKKRRRHSNEVQFAAMGNHSRKVVIKLSNDDFNRHRKRPIEKQRPDQNPNSYPNLKSRSSGKPIRECNHHDEDSGKVFPDLPSFEELQVGDITIDTTFRITDDCSVMSSKTENLYQFTSSPLDCVNLAMLLAKVLPNSKVDFESTTFMTLENIVIRSFSLDISNKEVRISAGYTDTVTLIDDILTISNIRVEFSFLWTRWEKVEFNMAGSFSVGSTPVDIRVIRNEQGYYLSGHALSNITATSLSRLFKQECSFLPKNCHTTQLKRAGFDKFNIISPRIKATFADGFGFLVEGSVQFLSWAPFNVNVLINKPNDLETTVTIAVYTSSFSIATVLKDLFEIDVSDVPVLGSVEVRNMAFSLSTGDVPTPLTVLEIGSEDIFDIPYQKGLKISFEIPIAEIYVSSFLFISPNEISCTISQNGELTLGNVIQEFLPENSFTETTDDMTTLKSWPSFLPDPLTMALLSFHLEAAKPQNSWTLTKMNMNLKILHEISWLSGRLRINDLELELNYDKSKCETNALFGVVSGKVCIGEQSCSIPCVDIRIPFPFANEEISFTFTDFSVKNIVNALAGSQVTFPVDFPELFEQIQLDKIAIGFDKKSSFSKVSIDASIAGLWTVFGSFSIGNVEIHFLYEKHNDEVGGATWRILLQGDFVFASCTIGVQAEFGTDRLSFDANGEDCSASIADILEKANMNGIELPSIIAGFSIFNPRLKLEWQRSGDNKGSKSLAFSATTNVFHQSEIELAVIRHEQQSAIVAGFAVEANAISEISFLSSLGLKNVAVVYVSRKISIAPYTFLNPVFTKYITPTPESTGITIYGSFEPNPNNMLGKILHEGAYKDPSLKPAYGNNVAIIVKISYPNFIFELEVDLGDEGLQIGSISGWKFTYMKLIISKRLIGLSLQCKVNLDNEKSPSVFTGEVSLTFSGTVTISMLWEGSWNNPLGISKSFTIRRMGLSLGINIASLLPSFGITGSMKVDIPSATSINVGLSLCIDPSSPYNTVFDLHFTRLLLSDLINIFAGKEIKLPKNLADVGFPDEVRIYVSPGGNPSCFGKSYDPGVEIRGTFQIPFLSIRARIHLSINLQPNFLLDADLQLDPIIYLDGLMKIVNADTDTEGAHLRMRLSQSLKDLEIYGSCRVEIFGAMISINLQINMHKFFFEGRLNLWNLFQVRILVDISLTATSPSLHVVGEMQNDFFAKIKQKAAQGIQKGALLISEKIQGAIGKIDNAKHEVNNLENLIDYHRRKIEEAKHECSQAPWYKKYICIGTAAKVVYHGTVMGTLWLAHKAAIGVLEAAKYFLKGVQAIIKVGADVLQQLVNAALSLIDIQYVKFDMQLSKVTKVFNFDARIVILDWTFEPHFSIDFSSSQSANAGINAVSQDVSDMTLKNVKK